MFRRRAAAASVTVHARAGPTIGIVTDPDSPTDVASTLTDGLTDWLNKRTAENWQVEVICDPCAVDAPGISELLDTFMQMREARGWRYLIGATDLPLLLEDRPAVAEWDRQRGVAVVSLPSLGVLLRYRLRRMFTLLLGELLETEDATEKDTGLHLVDSTKETEQDSSARYSVNPVLGWPILVMGMVRANQPWHLVFGLSNALAAALAASAFGLSSSTIWQLADLLPVRRRMIAAVLAVTVLVSWLILSHRLWEGRKARQEGFRRLAVVYNITTLATLLVGALVLYAGIFLLNLGVCWFLVPVDLLNTTLGYPPGFGTYLALAWGFTTLGILAGAVGSSLDSDQRVRQAAYGQREKYRLRCLRE